MPDAHTETGQGDSRNTSASSTSYRQQHDEPCPMPRCELEALPSPEELQQQQHSQQQHFQQQGPQSSRGHSASSAASSCPGQGHRQPAKRKVLNPELALRLAQKHNKSLSMKDLRTIMSLRANGLGITGVEDLACMARLETLYLYDNLLENVQGINALQSLTHLYLANNRITDMSHLTNMPLLQKLYLQGNHISYVTGLHGMLSLEELYVSDQKLEPGVSMHFDPSSMQDIVPSLRHLDALNCNITDDCLGSLQGLRDLRKLDLAGNNIRSFEAIEGVVETAPYLLHIDLRNNPLCKILKYREHMIVMSDSLRTIDGHEVLESQRQSLLRLQVKKMKMEQKAEERGELKQRASPSPSMSGGGATQPMLAGQQPHIPPPRAAAPFGYLRGATANGRHDLAGSPAGFGQPRHLAKQATHGVQQRTLQGQPAGQRSLSMGHGTSTQLASALDNLQ